MAIVSAIKHRLRNMSGTLTLTAVGGGVAEVAILTATQGPSILHVTQLVLAAGV